MAGENGSLKTLIQKPHTEMASTDLPFWRYDNVKKPKCLMKVHVQRFFRMDLSGRAFADFSKHNPVTDIMGNEIRLKREVYRTTGNISRHLVYLVDMLMDAVQWSNLFPNIFSNTTVLVVLSTGNPDRALQVMRAVFSLPSPLFPAREFTFSRHCKQLSPSTWVVVDVSLETFFEQKLTRFKRKPSGVLIQGLGDGNSRKLQGFFGY